MAAYSPQMQPCTLYGRPGWGSAIIEAQLAWYGLPFELVDVDDLFQSEEARARLAPLNPITQVPTVTWPDGTVMTESAAITLYLADRTGRDDLVPGPTAAERAPFLRWLVYLVANVYPTFTYGDDPSRFVSVDAARQPFREALDAYGVRLWTHVEGAAGQPWFLGDRFSALDLYVGVMTRWRPRRAWFAAHAPKLSAIAEAVDRSPKLRPVWDRHFGAIQ